MEASSSQLHPDWTHRMAREVRFAQVCTVQAFISKSEQVPHNLTAHTYMGPRTSSSPQIYPSSPFYRHYSLCISLSLYLSIQHPTKPNQTQEPYCCPFCAPTTLASIGITYLIPNHFVIMKLTVYFKPSFQAYPPAPTHPHTLTHTHTLTLTPRTPT